MNRKSLSGRFNSWIFHSYRAVPEGLALYRIFVALMILFFLMPPSAFYTYLGSLPDDFYQPPPGPMMLFSSFPSGEFLWGVHLLLTVSLTAMLLGFYTKWSSLFTGILFLVLNGFIYSIGKINHDIVIALVPIVFAFSNWGRAYSLDAWLERSEGNAESWPFSLLALFIGFMFFTAGFPKILGGWLDPSTQATRGHFFNQYFPKDRTDLMADTALGVDSVFFWEFLDIATIIFEAGFLIAIIHPFTTRLFICIAVIFHFSTMMIMNIAFLFNFIAYAAFLNWEWVHVKLHSVVRRSCSVWKGGISGVSGLRKGQGAGNGEITGEERPAVDSSPIPDFALTSAAGWIWGSLLTALFSLILIVGSGGYFIDQSDLVTYEVILLSLFFPVAIYGIMKESVLIAGRIREKR